MAREELISSAVTFLQDPSVAASPLEKRVAFLQSKNLTQEEIDIAIARAGDESVQTTTTTTATTPVGYNQQQQSPVYRPAASQPGYGHAPYGQWQPPPEVPRRDWRDWFIMATITGGVGYGLYVLAKRYVVPIIAPPTPPQLEQDKQSIDEEFARAFALIDQLSTDTAALKSAEEARTERLDAALREVESVMAELKSSTRRRDDETRRITDEVRNLKDSIPKALEGAKEGNESRLKELGTELRSLKTLLNNRLSAGSSSIPVSGRPLGSSPTAEPASSPAPASTTPSTTIATSAPNASVSSSQASSTTSSTNPLSQLGRSASIPAWQMAAANRSKAASQPTVSTPAEESQNSAPTN